MPMYLSFLPGPISSILNERNRRTMKTSGNGSVTACSRQSNRGFTLMEVLVSITLMGFLTVAIHYGYRIGLDSWSRAEKSMERNRRVEFVLDLISRQLASMTPYYSRQTLNGAPVDVLLFHGTDQGVRFVSTFSAESRNAGGVRLVEYFVGDSPEGEGKALLLNDRPLPPDEVLGQTVFAGLSNGEGNTVIAEFQSFSANSETTVLIDGLATVSFLFPRREAKEQAATAAVDPGEEVLPGRLGVLMQVVRESEGINPSLNKKERLPLGVEVKLQWMDTGFFQASEFAMAVPVQASF